MGSGAGKSKKPRRLKKRPPPLKYDPEFLFTLYAKHQGNLHAVLRNESGPGIPKQRSTFRNYEDRLDWPARLAALQTEASRRADAKAATRASSKLAALIDKLETALEIQAERLLAEKGEFNPDTQGGLLRAYAQALKDAQFLRGGPSERTDSGFGLTMDELEEAAKHPDGLRAGVAALRRRKYGDRLPERLPDE